MGEAESSEIRGIAMFTVELTNTDREVLFRLLHDRMLYPESWLYRQLLDSLSLRQRRTLARLRDKLALKD